MSPHTVLETDLARCVGVFDFLDVAERAHAAGVISAAEAAAWLGDLGEASRAGYFFCAMTTLVVCGTKPGR